MCLKNIKRYFISIQEGKEESVCLWELTYTETAPIFLATTYLGKWAPILLPPSFRALREGGGQILWPVKLWICRMKLSSWRT